MITKSLELRCPEGYFSHPNFPSWDEDTKEDVITGWFALNKGKSFCLELDGHCSEELEEAYFGQGETNISSWEPTLPTEDSFLLSIHDTENGPVAVFFIPNQEER